MLEELRKALKKRRYIPIIFDFEQSRRGLIETVMLLGGLSAFILVDITNPRSTPLELQATAPSGAPLIDSDPSGSTIVSVHPEKSA